MSPRKVITTSARKSAPGGGPSFNPLWAAVAAVAVIALLVVLLRPRPEPDATPTAPSPTTARPSTPRAEVPTPVSDGFVFPALEAETPTPVEELVAPTPPPAVAAKSCISFRWTAGLVRGSEEPLLVQVTLTNSCQEPLTNISVVFEARGYSGDEQRQSAQGGFSGNLEPGASSELEITLPGVAGGFDRIDVQPAG